MRKLKKREHDQKESVVAMRRSCSCDISCPCDPIPTQAVQSKASGAISALRSSMYSY